MSTDPDDDALSWDGDAALDAPRPEPVAPAVVPRYAQRGIDTPSEDAEAPEGIGTVGLVLLGILGGVYLLYTVGWFVGGVGMQSKALFMLPAPFFHASMWIAVAAPALWFIATLLLTRGSKDWVRIAALVVGAALLVPWPFVVAGGGGAL